jgi:hypothetical protein
MGMTKHTYFRSPDRSEEVEQRGGEWVGLTTGTAFPSWEIRKYVSKETYEKHLQGQRVAKGRRDSVAAHVRREIERLASDGRLTSWSWAVEVPTSASWCSECGADEYEKVLLSDATHEQLRAFEKWVNVEIHTLQLRLREVRKLRWDAFVKEAAK